MNKISPSVMCIDMLNLKKEIIALDNAGVDYYHIDIMDGNYVPNFALNADLMKTISSISDTPMDVHLMVSDPTSYIDMFADSGAEIITLHLETLIHPIRTMKYIRSLGKKAGLAINPATDISSLKYLLEFIDLVCVMSVDPGFAGQTLIPSAYSKIKEIRTLINDSGRDIDIMVDGQVKEGTADKFSAAGANVLVLGSSGLFCHKQSEYRDVIERYKKI